MKFIRHTALGLLLACALANAPARAADLTVGIAVEPDSIDPHFHYFGGTLDFTLNVFEPLVGVAADTSLYPLLAKSWKLVNDDTWEFDLRPGVKFSDGTPLTSADVAFTFQRARNVPHSPGGFLPYLSHIVSVDTPDPETVIIHTDGTVPLMPAYLSRVGIISRHAGQDATTADYNTGKAAIGTGPYRFVTWQHGDYIELKRNDSYWGPKPAWENVKLRYISNAASRVAAMLAGDVDMIDSVSVDDLARLKQDKALRITEAPSSTVIAFQIDTAQRKPPYITGPNGEALTTNPLADTRVRRAMAMAINREAMKDRLFNGNIQVATQTMAPGQFGYDPNLKPPPYDPAGAKKLLAEAGYPNGFQLNMFCQADRYPKGPEICQTAAQMFTRIGIKATPTLIPHVVFVPRANKHEFSWFTMFMIVDSDEPGEAMFQTFGSASFAKGWGLLNRGQYSNPAVDQALNAAAHDVNPKTREAELRTAVDGTINDVAWVPLFRPLNIEAMKATLNHPAHADGYILAADVMGTK